MEKKEKSFAENILSKQAKSPAKDKMNTHNFINHSINIKTFEEKNFDIAMWIRFLQEQKVEKLFSSLPDPRQQAKIKYPISTLLMWAFNLCAFRQGSKNALQTTLESLPADLQEGFLKLLGFQGNTIPHSTTVDHALSRIPSEEINKLLFKQIDLLIKKKLFYNHPELFPGNILHIGVDGYWVHKYEHPHAVDKEGNNICPYCLPRTHHKGTAKEQNYFVHAFVTFVLIAENFTLPLYVYPLKSQQVDVKTSDAKLKQECELKATYDILPLFRKKYPRLNITFLGDALYATRPFIRLCKSLKFNYLVVLKNNLKLVNKKCDELSTLDLYQTSYTHKEIVVSNKKSTKRVASWFNHVAVGEDVYTNVLRFKESLLNEDGSSQDDYECRWICSQKLSKGNCLKYAGRARSRWNHENLHNTCKNRGFEIEHDMARANPNLLIVWKIIIFIAFFFFEIFRHSTLAILGKKTRSLMKFAKDLLGQLLNMSWNTIAQSPVLQKKRVQFRFHFGSDP